MFPNLLRQSSLFLAHLCSISSKLLVNKVNGKVSINSRIELIEEKPWTKSLFLRVFYRNNPEHCQCCALPVFCCENLFHRRKFQVFFIIYLLHFLIVMVIIWNVDRHCCYWLNHRRTSKKLLGLSVERMWIRRHFQDKRCSVNIVHIMLKH